MLPHSNLIMMHEGIPPKPKELEQLTHSQSTKRATANEFTRIQEAVSNVVITERR